MRRYTLASVLAALWMFFVDVPAVAGERYALLIGVTSYPTLSADKQLRGPKNDVALIYKTLIDDGVPKDNIIVVADGISENIYQLPIKSLGEPTRNNIVAGFRRLSQRVKAGDRAMIFMAGHGSFKPEPAKDAGETEDDGTDELFLPRDIGKWTVENSQVQNEIVDDQIGDLITDLIQRGVFVWLVVDACHSGTAARSSGGDGSVFRDVAPAALGIPPGGFARTTRGPSSGGQSLDSLGGLGRTPASKGFVAFYAVQPTQRAPERNLAETGKPPAWHGVFTWALVQALRSQQASSYSVLAQRIAATYVDMRATDPTGAIAPYFEGNLGSTPMAFAGVERSLRVEYERGDFYVRAGAADDVGVGTIIAVRRRHGTQGDVPLFYGRVVEVEVDRARLEIITDDPERPSRLEAFRAERGLDSQTALNIAMTREAPTFAAGVVERVPDFVLRVAASEGVSGQAAQAVAELRRTPATELPMALDWVGVSGTADVLLRVAEGRLWFTAPGTDLVTRGSRQPYSLSLTEVTREKLGEALRTIGRARNLLRMAQAYGETPVARALEVSVSIIRGSDRVGGTCPLHRVVSVVPVNATLVDPADFAAGRIRLSTCDRVYVAISNRGTTPTDITPLYIDLWLRTIFFGGYPGNGEGLRIGPGQTRVVSWTQTATPPGELSIFGPAKLVLVAVEAPRGSSYGVRFDNLAADLPPAGRSAALAGQTGFAKALLMATQGDGSVRSGPATNGRGGVIAIGFETVPAGQASPASTSTADLRWP